MQPKNAQDRIQNAQKLVNRHRSDLQVWETSQIRKLFKLYNEFGSQWKLISEQLAQRSPNSIKNRFFTYLRKFLKAIFKHHSRIKIKLPHQIPSKTITKLYQGKREFSHLKGFIKKVVNDCKYTLQQSKLIQVAQVHESQILTIFNIIYRNQIPSGALVVQELQENPIQILQSDQQQAIQHVPEIEGNNQNIQFGSQIGENAANNYQQIFFMPVYFIQPYQQSYQFD